MPCVSTSRKRCTACLVAVPTRSSTARPGCRTAPARARRPRRGVRSPAGAQRVLHGPVVPEETSGGEARISTHETGILGGERAGAEQPVAVAARAVPGQRRIDAPDQRDRRGQRRVRPGHLGRALDRHQLAARRTGPDLDRVGDPVTSGRHIGGQPALALALALGAAACHPVGVQPCPEGDEITTAPERDVDGGHEFVRGQPGRGPLGSGDVLTGEPGEVRQLGLRDPCLAACGSDGVCAVSPGRRTPRRWVRGRPDVRTPASVPGSIIVTGYRG